MSVAGLYAALLELHRRGAQPDPRAMRWHHPDGGYCTYSGTVCEHEPVPILRSHILDDLEAGRPVRLQGRQLRGVSLPNTRLRRDQAFDWFEVRSDDTVSPA